MTRCGAPAKQLRFVARCLFGAADGCSAMLAPPDRLGSAGGPQCPVMVDMQGDRRRQDHEYRASITCMIRHYVARRAQVTEGHPHNAE